MASNRQRVGLYARVSTFVGQSPEMQLSNCEITQPVVDGNWSRNTSITEFRG